MNFDTSIVENKAQSSKAGDRKAHSPKRIKRGELRFSSLVVDDDGKILKYVAQMLTRLGCQVQTAQEKPDVMNKLTTGTYDLLLTDLEMPEMNGYHLTLSIKKEMHDTKVIIMTGCHEHDCLDMMASGWADGWLFKPFGLKDLRAMLQRLGLLND
jgi:CheY-like chemotaxis protein